MPESPNVSKTLRLPKQLTRLQGGTLGLLILCLIALRLQNATESLWLDELHTAWVISGNMSEVLPRALIGNQSPFFFWLVSFTTILSTENEISLRLPSLICGIGLIPLSFLLVWRWTQSVSAAFLTSALMSIDPDYIFYAQEARPYACVQLVVLLQILSFARFMSCCVPELRSHETQTASKSSWSHVDVPLISSSLILCYLHYTALAILAVEFLVVIETICCWHPPRKFYRRLFIFSCLFVVGILPAVPHMIEIGSRRSNWNQFISAEITFADWATMIPWLPYCIVPMGFMITSRITARIVAEQPAPSVQCTSLWWFWRLSALWVIIPMTIAALLTISDSARVFLLRYVIITTVAAPIFAGLCLALTPSHLAKTLLFLSALTAALWQSQIIPLWMNEGLVIAPRNEDWRSAIEHINQEAVYTDLPLLLRSGLIEADALDRNPSAELREYCLLPVSGLYRINNSQQEIFSLLTTRPGTLDSKIVSAVSKAGGALLLTKGGESTAATISELVSARMAASGVKMKPSKPKSFGTIQVTILLAI